MKSPFQAKHINDSTSMFIKDLVRWRHYSVKLKKKKQRYYAHITIVAS